MYGPMTTAMIVQDKRRYGRGSSTNPARNADRFKAGGSTRDSNLLDAAESAAESTEKQPHVPTMQLEKGDSHSVTAFMTQLEDDIADATAGQDGEGNAVLEQVEEELESNWRDYYSSGSHSDSDSEIEDETIQPATISAGISRSLLLKVDAVFLSLSSSCCLGETRSSLTRLDCRTGGHQRNHIARYGNEGSR